jgi:hypothetical protein
MLLTVSFFCVPSNAFCNERKQGGYNPKESFEDFSRKLNLTKEQKEKVRPILNEEVNKIKEVYAEAWEKEKKILEEHRQKVMDVLNPQQKEKYRKMIESRKKGQRKSGEEVYVPAVITVIVADPAAYYGKSVVAEGYVKRVLTKDSFILSDAPEGEAEIVVIRSGRTADQSPKKGEKVSVSGLFQKFNIDATEKALGVDLDEGLFGLLENKPGIFARKVKKQ